ncbi:hypothetical protein PLESTM_000985900 [Pleodorina starrii]|nr:hypothetical protein PLESTM_000985900 [Pleodorina starrii]
MCVGGWVRGEEWSGLDWSGGVEWSGVEWSGVEWSGVEWSGVEWAGLEWSGVEWNGVEWNGAPRSVRCSVRLVFADKKEYLTCGAARWNGGDMYRTDAYVFIA